MVDDLAKLTRLVLKVADMDEPPLHLLAGSDALFVGQEQTAYLAAHDEKIGSSVCLLTLRSSRREGDLL